MTPRTSSALCSSPASPCSSNNFEIGSSQHESQQQSNRPCHRIHKQEMFRYHIVSKISLPAHNFLPELICALHALNELPHPDVIFAVVFFITNPEPSLCSA